MVDGMGISVAVARSLPGVAGARVTGGGEVSDVASGITGALVKMLDVRVPTTTPEISEDRRQQVLSSIRPGDVILETDDAYPGWQIMEFLTMRSSFTHAAIYEGDGKFLEATTPGGVQRTDLDGYLHGRMHVAVIRPPYRAPGDVDATLEYARAQLGKPYDNDFNTADDREMYCAEYVYKALKASPNPIEAPIRHVMAKTVVSPDAFRKIPGSTVVYADRCSFLSNRLSHWPVYSMSLAAAATGASMAGPVGGAVGFVAGSLASILVGNRLQTGHFNLVGDAKGKHPR